MLDVFAAEADVRVVALSLEHLHEQVAALEGQPLFLVLFLFVGELPLVTGVVGLCLCV